MVTEVIVLEIVLEIILDNELLELDVVEDWLVPGAPNTVEVCKEGIDDVSECRAVVLEGTGSEEVPAWPGR